MESEFLIFCMVGFLAQLVDGALGMAYGLVSSTVLLSFGVPPAQASAAVHAAELFTTAASGASHTWQRNVDLKLLARLAPAGIVGGVVGAFVLTSFEGGAIRPYVLIYLALPRGVPYFPHVPAFPSQAGTPRHCVAARRSGRFSGCGRGRRMGTDRDLQPDRRRRVSPVM
jgi:uncharacterized membrane protein YfcA